MSIGEQAKEVGWEKGEKWAALGFDWVKPAS